MSLTAIGLCSRALLKIGARPITSFTEGTAEAEVADALYAPLRDGLLSANAWSFATVQARLARLEAPPAADYDAAFQLPADFLRALSAGSSVRGHAITYRIVRRTLEADAEDIVLTYVFRPPEEEFPPFFDLALIARLSAEFCLPLTESTSRAEMLARVAEHEFRRARLIDAQQDAQPAIEGFALTQARLG